jgi:hypothetical protein
MSELPSEDNLTRAIAMRRTIHLTQRFPLAINVAFISCPIGDKVLVLVAVA